MAKFSCPLTAHSTFSLTKNSWLAPISLVVLAFLLYANTLGHRFTQDDAIVIYSNQFTKSGIAGWGDIFSKDSFYGFFGDDKSDLVSGGRYRPMTLAYFAMLYQMVDESPFIYHLSNVLFFSLLAFIIYQCLVLLDLPKEKNQRRLFAFLTCLLFIVHPIHTEVVANVKGLDEILSLLFSICAFYAVIRYVKSQYSIWLLTAFCSFFVALLSKENAVVFTLFIPLTAYYFLEKANFSKISWVAGTMITAAILFLVLRGSIIGWSLGSPPSEMLNNPFIKLEGNQYLPFSAAEKMASIILGLGKYIQLLFVPHPLTHDYYPRHFAVVDMKDGAVLASLVMQISLITIAIIGLFKKSFISYCIIFYYGSLFLMSNILFPIGTHISERFLFTASLPFCLLVAYFSMMFLQNSKYKKGVVSLLTAVILLFSCKTFSRNQVWKDDYTLFTTDVVTSTNSAKVQNAAGGAIIDKSLQVTDSIEKNKMLQQAIGHLNEAVRIHPNYKNAHLLLGNAHLYLEKYEDAIREYDYTLRLDPYFQDATNNLIIALREGARYYGSKEKNYVLTRQLLERALQLSPNDYDINSLMGIAYGNQGLHKEALIYFDKALSIRPEIARAHVNRGYALLALGQEDEAQISFQKAISIDPNAMNTQ